MAWLKELLDRADKKQAELARRLGLPPSRISEVNSGKRKLQPNEIFPTAEFLEISIEELLARSTARLPHDRARLAKTVPSVLIATKSPGGASTDVYVPPIDRWEKRIHIADTTRDVPMFIGINPRTGLGDFEMGTDTGVFVRRPERLHGRSDIRAVYTQAGELLMLETAREPEKGDHVIVVLLSKEQWAPAYLRRFVGSSDVSVIIQQPDGADNFEVARSEIAAVYRVMTMADLYYRD